MGLGRSKTSAMHGFDVKSRVIVPVGTLM